MELVHWTGLGTWCRRSSRHLCSHTNFACWGWIISSGFPGPLPLRFWLHHPHTWVVGSVFSSHWCTLLGLRRDGSGMRVENSVHNSNASRCLSGWNMSHRYVIIVAYKWQQYYEVGGTANTNCLLVRIADHHWWLGRAIWMCHWIAERSFFSSSNAESMAWYHIPNTSQWFSVDVHFWRAWCRKRFNTQYCRVRKCLEIVSRKNSVSP